MKKKSKLVQNHCVLLTNKDTHSSKDHVERHGDVEAEGCVVDHADHEKHDHHRRPSPEICNFHIIFYKVLSTFTK